MPPEQVSAILQHVKDVERRERALRKTLDDANAQIERQQQEIMALRNELAARPSLQAWRTLRQRMQTIEANLSSTHDDLPQPGIVRLVSELFNAHRGLNVGWAFYCSHRVIFGKRTMKAKTYCAMHTVQNEGTTQSSVTNSTLSLGCITSTNSASALAASISRVSARLWTCPVSTNFRLQFSALSRFWKCLTMHSSLPSKLPI